MAIPTNFGVDVKTPDPIQIKIDVSERTMIIVAFVSIVGVLAVKQWRR